MPEPLTIANCRECRAGRHQASEFEIAWRCSQHGIVRASAAATQPADVDREAAIQRLIEAARAVLRMADGAWCDGCSMADGDHEEDCWIPPLHAALDALPERHSDDLTDSR